MGTRIIATLVVTVVAAGCGSGVDLTGTYRVDVHTEDPVGCTNLAQSAMPAPFVRFDKQDLLGHTFFTMSVCTDATQVDCPGGGGYGPYGEQIADGWRAWISFSQTAGGCTLDYLWAEAVLVDAQLTIDAAHHHDETDRPAADCQPETATDLAKEMPCVSAEHIEATKIE